MLLAFFSKRVWGRILRERTTLATSAAGSVERLTTKEVVSREEDAGSPTSCCPRRGAMAAKGGSYVGTSCVPPPSVGCRCCRAARNAPPSP